MSDGLNWFALLTRSNFEQTVHTAIVKKKIEAFLPKIKRKSSRKDRNLMIEIPALKKSSKLSIQNRMIECLHTI